MNKHTTYLLVLLEFYNTEASYYPHEPEIRERLYQQSEGIFRSLISDFKLTVDDVYGIMYDY